MDVSPTSTPCGTPLSGAPKYGTVIPNRIFVGGIAANVSGLILCCKYYLGNMLNATSCRLVMPAETKVN